MIKEKTIVSTATLASSLLMYFYARTAEKDAVPYVMIGGFMVTKKDTILVEKLNQLRILIVLNGETNYLKDVMV
jgi:hypothetical protein